MGVVAFGEASSSRLLLLVSELRRSRSGERSSVGDTDDVIGDIAGCGTLVCLTTPRR